MIVRNSRIAIIKNKTADAVCLQETTVFIRFQKAIISPHQTYALCLVNYHVV